MIEVVLAFGLINIVFEFVLLSMLKPRTRLRLLGNHNSQILLHIGFLLINLIVHWGTLIGTMSSILAFVCSIVTVRGAQLLYGSIAENRYYTLGIIKYSKAELA
jgi:hypothetical protein